MFEKLNGTVPSDELRQKLSDVGVNAGTDSFEGLYLLAPTYVQTADGDHAVLLMSWNGSEWCAQYVVDVTDQEYIAAEELSASHENPSEALGALILKAVESKVIEASDLYAAEEEAEGPETRSGEDEEDTDV